MKFKKGDMVLVNYEHARESDVGPNTMAVIYGLDRWTSTYPGSLQQDRIGEELAYKITILDPVQDMAPSHWAWEHELRRAITCPMEP